MAETSDEMYEQLLRILERQNGRSYTFEEAKEIGDGILDFYLLLVDWAKEEHIPKNNGEDHAIE